MDTNTALLPEGPLRNEADPNFWNLLYYATEANGKITHNDAKFESALE